MTWLLSYFDLVPWIAVGGGAAALSVFAVASPLPRATKTASTALCGLVAALCAGVVIGKDVTGIEVDRLKSERDSLVKLMELQSQNIQRQNQDLIDRNEANQQLQETVMTYQEALQNGEVSECVADPDYNQRVQSILDTLPTD